MSAAESNLALAASPEDEAAVWFARRRDGLSRSDEVAFAAWLDAEPAHLQAYQRITRAWELAGDVASDPRICAIRSEALAARPARTRRWPVFAAAAAGILALVGVVMLSLTSRDVAPEGPRVASAERVSRIHETAVGERTTFTLEDGSVVTLNTASRLRVDYTPERRGIVLLAGQAIFQVAHGQPRPFVVRAGASEIIAVGTQFEVRLESGAVRVALLEGRVNVRQVATAGAAVNDGPRPAPAATLEPGEQLVVTQIGAVTVAAADVENLTSWREGRVRFDDTPLSEAVAEMNRYSRTPILINDPRIASIRVSGAFRTGQSSTFVTAVTELFPIRAETTARGIELRGRS